jgi:hypothetical protein
MQETTRIGALTGRGKAAVRAAFAALLLAAPGSLAAQSAPTQTDLYCAGFFTRRAIETGLVIQSSENGGFKNEFHAGDYVYLNHGRDVIANVGGQYSVLRPMKDANLKEAFQGQDMLLRDMGTLYAEVARMEVEVLNDRSATARILTACEPVLAGDIAVPFNAKSAPAYKTPRQTARFAPVASRATGLIAAAKYFDRWIGEGKIVYMNLGSAEGLQVGSYLRVVRPYLGGGNTDFGEAVRNYPVDMNGERLGRRLTLGEETALPREVLGEVMVLSVEDGSATGIVTYSRAEVAVGDGVELE